MGTSFTTNFETGLLDDFAFTVTSAAYSFDAKYNNGETLLLKLDGKTDNLDIPETHIWIPLGKGWVSQDGGKTIIHESKKEGKYFMKTSLMAKWIERCVDQFGIGDLLNDRGNPFTSSVWVGLSFQMKNEAVSYGAGLDPQTKLLPVAFLGVDESVGSGSTTVASSGSSEPSAADKIAAAKAKAAAKASGGDLKSRVVEVLKSHDSFDAAQSAALEIDGVTDDDDLLGSLMDESGLWAEVNA